jgi:hypothetical protein
MRCKRVRIVNVDMNKLVDVTKNAVKSGRFFTVETTSRKSGNVFKMTGRGGVKKYIKGMSKKNYDPLKYDLITFWTKRKKAPNDAGYRSINLRGLKSVKYAHKIYQLSAKE